MPMYSLKCTSGHLSNYYTNLKTFFNWKISENFSLSETAKRLKSFFIVMNAAASSVTILGDFLKFLWHVFSLKLPKYIKTFWGATLKNIPFKTKTAVVTLRLLLVKFGLLFISTSGHTGSGCRRLNFFGKNIQNF